MICTNIMVLLSLCEWAFEMKIKSLTIEDMANICFSFVISMSLKVLYKLGNLSN